jgi:putative polyhydroxyalkanoate system protein
MADIDIRRPHSLGMRAAREAADQMAEDLGRKFGLSGGWTGNTHHFDRPGVTGSLHLTENELHLTVKLGLLLKMMRGPLETAILRELDTLFEKHGKKPSAGTAQAKPKAGDAPARKPASPKTGSGGRKKGG